MRTDLLVNGAQSRLHIAGASDSDSGNYTCMMGRTARAVIELQIIPGRPGRGGKGRLSSHFSLPRRDRRAGQGRQQGADEEGRDDRAGGCGGEPPQPPLLLEDGVRHRLLCQSAKCRIKLIFHFVMIKHFPVNPHVVI